MIYQKSKIYLILFLTASALNCKAQVEQPIFKEAVGSPFQVGRKPADVTLADVNNDANLDIITANAESRDITILLGDGRGSFKPPAGSPFSAHSAVHLIAAGDNNGDGNADIVSTEHDSYDITIMFGDGTGNFSFNPELKLKALNGSKPHNHGLALIDMNKDSKLDIITANHEDNNITVLLGEGNAKFSPAPGSPFMVKRGPYPFTVNDFNNDGNLDIAAPNLLGKSVTILSGNGRGEFSESALSPISVEERPYYVTTGDLNGDKWNDIVVVHDDITKAVILLNDGKGGFKYSSSSPYELGFTSFKIIIEDINSDSKKDLILTNTSSDKINILLGDGLGGFTKAPGSPYQTGDSPNYITIGDLNKDGKPDIISTNFNSNNVTVLLGR
ncbi:MAG: FG-GAP repeat domain-containing protein [Ignavibacteria bacterium]